MKRSEMTSSNCIYRGDEQDTGSRLECRHHIADAEEDAWFPITKPGLWCGQGRWRSNKAGVTQWFNWGDWEREEQYDQ